MCLEPFFLIAGVDAVRMYSSTLFHPVGQATQNACLRSVSSCLWYYSSSPRATQRYNSSCTVATCQSVACAACQEAVAVVQPRNDETVHYSDSCAPSTALNAMTAVSAGGNAILPWQVFFKRYMHTV